MILNYSINLSFKIFLTSFLGFLIIILMPIFINGIENSIALSLWEEIVNGATAKSASCLTNSPTIPFHTPLASKIIFIILKKLILN